MVLNVGIKAFWYTNMNIHKLSNTNMHIFSPTPTHTTPTHTTTKLDMIDFCNLIKKHYPKFMVAQKCRKKGSRIYIIYYLLKKVIAILR